MSAITFRNLPDETDRALKLRPARTGRSTEAKIRDILEEAIPPRNK
jgi:plasmid stability protein